MQIEQKKAGGSVAENILHAHGIYVGPSLTVFYYYQCNIYRLDTKPTEKDIGQEMKATMEEINVFKTSSRFRVYDIRHRIDDGEE